MLQDGKECFCQAAKRNKDIDTDFLCLTASVMLNFYFDIVLQKFVNPNVKLVYARFI